MRRHGNWGLKCAAVQDRALTLKLRVWFLNYLAVTAGGGGGEVEVNKTSASFFSAKNQKNTYNVIFKIK